ncbi:flagellar basal-body MS-ring/collar protein FliF [Peptoanaerobacter stomatis]|uniref:flagellar basal-body MS-ring/collar protein FliF n=1 Tax=Peptoanaerobacter stomatis TaxID=796937 RepID=UPI003F9EE951
MENINNVRNSINQYLEKYSRRQIITVAVSTLAIIAIVTSLILYLTRTKYVPLYSNLDLNTMSTVTQNLDGLGVKYKIEGQNSILVPEKIRNKVMVDLAGRNLPNAKFDYSDLIKMNSMFMSDDEKETARQYALTNQISTVIESIDAVDKAYVSLSIPKNSEFVLNENKQISKASVMLSLKSGKELDQDSINGIASIVSSSVEGLLPENVTIHGSNGQVLNVNSENKNDSIQAKSNLEMQDKVKSDIEKSLQNFLSPMFGYNNISVMASVKLNFDNEQTQTKSFSPPVEGETSGLARSEQNLKEQVENKKDALGTPGVTANNNEAGGTTNYVTVDENGNSTYNRSESTINYELNEIVKNVEKAKGTIDSITVSVILNKDSLEGGELTDEKKAQIVKLITTATGLNTKSVEVFAESFNKDMQNQMAASDNYGIPLWQWIAIGVIAFIPIASLLIIMLLRRRNRKLEEMAKQKDNLSAEERARKQKEIETIELDIKESGKKRSIEELINKNPEVVTQLLKTWIEEE